MQMYKLNNGKEIPAVGLGTYRLTPEDCERSVATAIEFGYRLFDTANVYMNERAVGRGIKASGVPREDIIVTSKIWPVEYKHAKAKRAIETTLARLGLDYIDILLLHQPFGDVKGAWTATEEAIAEGKVLMPGVSNFNENDLEKLLSYAVVAPVLNQVECHPYYQQHALHGFMKQHGILLESWYPLGSGDANLMAEPVICRLAKKYGKTPVQIVLRWHVEEGYIVVPGSKNSAHIRENFDIFDFAFTAEELAEIRLLDREKRYFKMRRSIQKYMVFLQRMNYDKQR